MAAKVVLMVAFGFLAGYSQEFIQAGMDDYKPRFKNKKNFNETWSYQIALDNGTQVYLDLSRLNDGSNKYTTANLFFVNFNKRNKHVTCQYPAHKYFNYAKSGENFTLKFHKRIYVEGSSTTQKIKFYRKKKDVRYFLELDITEMAAGYKIKNDAVKLKDKNTTGYILHFPTARVSGRIAVNNDTLNVTGQGMMDHAYQSDLPTNIFRKGIRYFKIGDKVEAGLIFMGNKSNKNQIVGFGVIGSPDSMTPHNPVSMSKHMGEIKFTDNYTVKFTKFKKMDEWGVLDEAPKGLGFLVGAIKKDLVHKRGIGTTADGSSFVLTKFYVD